MRAGGFNLGCAAINAGFAVFCLAADNPLGVGLNLIFAAMNVAFAVILRALD